MCKTGDYTSWTKWSFQTFHVARFPGALEHVKWIERVCGIILNTCEFRGRLRAQVDRARHKRIGTDERNPQVRRPPEQDGGSRIAHSDTLIKCSGAHSYLATLVYTGSGGKYRSLFLSTRKNVAKLV